MRTETILIQLGVGASASTLYAANIDRFCITYNLTAPHVFAAFIANILTETGLLTEFSENLNYSVNGLLNTWPNRFYNGDGANCDKNYDDTSRDYNKYDANCYGRNDHDSADEEGIANIAYSNRYGNGDFESNDGFDFRGRGLIQCTFLDNYVAAKNATGIDFVSNPDLMISPEPSTRAACSFFSSPKILQAANSGDIIRVRALVNGGSNGLKTTQNLYSKTCTLIGV